MYLESVRNAHPEDVVELSGRVKLSTGVEVLPAELSTLKDGYRCLARLLASSEVDRCLAAGRLVYCAPQIVVDFLPADTNAE